MIQNLEVILVAHYPGPRNVPQQDFLERLNVAGYELGSSTQRWESARVYLLRSKFADFGNAEDASTRFYAHINETLVRASLWLASHPLSLFEEFDHRGLKVQMFFDMWIDQDQMDLVLPPEFLRSCGERGIPIRILTND